MQTSVNLILSQAFEVDFSDPQVRRDIKQSDPSRYYAATDAAMALRYCFKHQSELKENLSLSNEDPFELIFSSLDVYWSRSRSNAKRLAA